MIPPNLTPPSLTWCLTIDVELGPEVSLGRVPEGERIDFPIIGGRFVGRDPAGGDLAGEVLAGGADNFLMRDDYIGLLDASYQLRTRDGVVIDIRNRGLWVPDEAGRAKLSRGEEPADVELYCRCSPVFCVAAGKYDWVNGCVFVGRVSYPRHRQVTIQCWKVD